MRYDAIILAGGQGSRLGGVDKARLDLVGLPLIARPLAACADAVRVVIVGPADLTDLIPSSRNLRGSGAGSEADTVSHCPADRVRVTREDPPGGGPAAGTAAGASVLARDAGAEWVVLLSCDLPLAEAGVRRLLAAAEGDEGRGVDGYCLTDADGRLQWLFGIYRTSSLAGAVRNCEQPSGTSMRRLLRGLRLTGIPATEQISGDLDTWEDHAAWTARLESQG